jgi:hypothetical protein
MQEQARQQQYERAREWAYRGGQQYQYGQQQQQRPREPGAAPGDPLGYYKALGMISWGNWPFLCVCFGHLLLHVFGAGVERNATTDDIKKAFRKQVCGRLKIVRGQKG